MEFYAVVKHNGKYYSWVEHPGHICSGYCDLYGICRSGVAGGDSIHSLCATMRDIVGSSTTHRFKEVHLEP